MEVIVCVCVCRHRERDENERGKGRVGIFTFVSLHLCFRFVSGQVNCSQVTIDRNCGQNFSHAPPPAEILVFKYLFALVLP